MKRGARIIVRQGVGGNRDAGTVGGRRLADGGTEGPKVDTGKRGDRVARKQGCKEAGKYPTRYAWRRDDAEAPSRKPIRANGRRRSVGSWR